MAITGTKTSFWLDNAAGVLTDISTFLRGVTPTTDTERPDGTTFQPLVAVPVKNLIPGFVTKGYDLDVVWSSAAEVFFSGIEGKTGLNYQYGPAGTAVGSTKITGLCNGSDWSGGTSTVGDVTAGSFHLDVSSRTLGTF
jgi:hypothetical protein